MAEGSQPTFISSVGPSITGVSDIHRHVESRLGIKPTRSIGNFSGREAAQLELKAVVIDLQAFAWLYMEGCRSGEY